MNARAASGFGAGPLSRVSRQSVMLALRLFAVTETGPKSVAPRTRTPISISGNSTRTARKGSP